MNLEQVDRKNSCTCFFYLFREHDYEYDAYHCVHYVRR